MRDFRFLKKSTVLVAAVSAAFAGDAGAAAGWVDFAAGATIADAQGRQRALVKGDNIDRGDTVRTGEGGRAQIRFTDGAYVSLQPNTEFAVKDYAFDGKTDGSERGFFALARGAMRTVTGLIGRVNKNRYQVSTPTATIGIRGTGGLIAVLNDGSTLINGTSGIWTLTNPSGTIDVPAGVSGKAPSAPNQPPQQTTEKPSTGPAQPPTTQPPYTQADQRTDTGATETLCGTGLVTNCTTTAVKPVLVSGSGYASGAAFATGVAAPVPQLDGGTGSTATFDAQGRLTSLTVGANTYTLSTSGTHAEFGTDGILAWGRWTGLVNMTTPMTYSANQGFHWIAGMPTAAMPTTGTAVYNMIGSTSPTYVNGSTAPGTVTGGQFSVTFGGTASITLSGFGVSMPDGATYSMATTTTTTSTSTFSMSPLTSGAGGACGACGCTTTMNGFFAGTSAERIGTSYHINDSTGRNVLGTAAYSK